MTGEEEEEEAGPRVEKPKKGSTKAAPVVAQAPKLEKLDAPPKKGKRVGNSSKSGPVDDNPFEVTETKSSSKAVNKVTNQLDIFDPFGTAAPAGNSKAQSDPFDFASSTTSSKPASSDPVSELLSKVAAKSTPAANPYPPAPGPYAPPAGFYPPPGYGAYPPQPVYGAPYGQYPPAQGVPPGAYQQPAPAAKSKNPFDDPW